MNSAIMVVIILSAVVVLLEALNKLERCDARLRYKTFKQGLFVWIGIAGWLLSCVMAMVILIAPLAGIKLQPSPETVFVVAVALLIVFRRCKECGRQGKQLRMSDFVG